ncbi:MAG: 1-phosphofructokinase [Erysipelotrichaceae bacterium]|nr:1-phosphofructokinase [Erysipelotrichaceae bacterium]
MIYTLTLNPALDYVIRVDDFQTGQMNRIREEHIYYGGKGINVSAILRELNTESCALGFAAGFTGQQLEKGLQAKRIRTDFLFVRKGMTRINIKMKSNDETEINGQGPQIEADEMEALIEKIRRIQAGDWFVISGNMPASLPSDAYTRILDALDRDVCLIVDAENELVRQALAYRPFLIKPNKEELETFFQTRLEDPSQIIACAKQLQDMGASNVLVSLAQQGSLLIDRQGHVVSQPTLKGTIVNSVGAGDSMVAGVLAALAQQKDWQTALRWGTACGAATAFHSGLATGDQIKECLRELESLSKG